jgi:hypothetical protein
MEKITIESIPGMGGGRIKEMVEEVNSSMIYLISCKNLYKWHYILLPRTTIKKLKRKCGINYNGIVFSYKEE